jgi:hypothetical protein
LCGAFQKKKKAQYIQLASHLKKTPCEISLREKRADRRRAEEELDEIGATLSDNTVEEKYPVNLSLLY